MRYLNFSRETSNIAHNVWHVRRFQKSKIQFPRLTIMYTTQLLLRQALVSRASCEDCEATFFINIPREYVLHEKKKSHKFFAVHGVLLNWIRHEDFKNAEFLTFLQLREVDNSIDTRAMFADNYTDFIHFCEFLIFPILEEHIVHYSSRCSSPQLFLAS